MISLSIKGTLGKFGYSNIPDDIVDEILQISGLHAYKTAVNKAPYLAEHPIHLRESIHMWWDKQKRIFSIIATSPYANITEFGSKKRFPHPFMRPAAKAAQYMMRSIIRKSTKDAVARGGK